MASSEELLQRLVDLQMAQIPTGGKSLTKAITNQTLKITCTPPWISFTLINDGPGKISVWINSQDGFQDNIISSGNNFVIDFRFPIINSVYLQSDSTCVARISCIQGRNIQGLV